RVEEYDPMANTVTLFGREVPMFAAVGGVVVGVLVIVSAFNLALVALTPHTHATIYDQPRQLETFTLPYADGSGTFSSDEMLGKTVVYYFGFTSCPDVCPEAMFNLKRAYNALTPRQQEQVEVVFITIDWDVDTPERIAQYVGAFHEDFTGLAGDAQSIEPVMDQFNVAVFRSGEDPMAPGYSITHTTSMFIVSPEGRLVMRMGHTSDPNPEYMARDLRYVINGRVK
ncbi:MAG: SCO family protein, partial [Anaerolineae bacterium]